MTARKTIVVTGLLGSGKSALSRLLEKKGIPVYDCDSRVKALYAVHPEIASLLCPDIFSDPQRLLSLENALYPVLTADFERWAHDSGMQFVAMESAILLQKPYFEDFGDYVLLLDAPLEMRLERARRRGGISEESLRQRMLLQTDQKTNPRVSRVIDNSATLEHMEKQLDEFLKDIDYVKREN